MKYELTKLKVVDQLGLTDNWLRSFPGDSRRNTKLLAAALYSHHQVIHLQVFVLFRTDGDLHC